MGETAAYDDIAEWYDEIVEQDGFQHGLVVPVLLDLVGDVRGRRVCDLACGQGYVSRRLALRGAEVVGIDVSTKLLELAQQRERAEPLGIDYRNGDAQDLGVLAGERFDGVACNMALIAIPDLDATLATVSECIGPAGWFVFSITQPCFQAPGSEWFTDETGRRGRRVYEYFDERAWRSANPNGVRGRVGDHHRTLSTYVNTLADHGLLVEAMVEPRRPASDELPADDLIPSTLVARCIKR
jgi:ubiquinone/menaquinone biosynthesis C-methylase UbiE